MSSEHEEQQEGLQMSFLDHLDELRRRLIQSALAITIAFAVCFAVSDYIVRHPANSPTPRQSKHQTLI